MHGMNYIGRFLSNFKDFYNDINTATLTGAIDVIVVEQPDGTYKCSPFHVRFGKLGVLRSKEKVVDIEINGEPQDIHMKLGESGEAFFVEELEGSEMELPEHLATSPIPVSEFENLYISQSRRRRSIDLGENQLMVENQISDFSKRRNTADSERHSSAKVRGRDFLEKQIALGNIGLTENSTEDLTLSLPSNAKISSDDISKDDYSETIFKMDSLDMDNSKSEHSPPPTKVITKEQETVTVGVKDEAAGENKGGKKKRRRRSLLKKKTLQKKSASVTELSTIDVDSLQENVATDRSSLDSNGSEPELKELQKYDSESALNTNTRKVPLDPDFHFFSDTELTNTTADSRPGSPTQIETVQSDTEFEVKKSKDDAVEEKARNSWAWGQFPSVSQNTGGIVTAADGVVMEQEQHNSMLASMFSFMKQSKHRNLAGNEGVYLADISSGAMDPEVVAQYFNTTKKQAADADMDCESGNGPSLTQSPNSPDGCKSVDSDFDEHNKLAQNFMQDMSLSLCGWDPEPTEENFIKHSVPFSDICNNPALFESPNLVVRIHDKYYNWKVAAPIVSSFIIYQRPLPQSTVEQLCNLYMPASTSGSQAKDKQETRYSWWSWRRSRPSREATPASDVVTALETATTTTTTKDSTVVAEIKELDEADTAKVMEVKKVESEKTVVVDPDEAPKTPISDKFKKSLRLSSDQIARLNLHDGMNKVEFSVTTAYQGTTRCTCYLYKWKWDDKIVISDIDGTITKSDVLGHILPIVGKDWAQSGVAQLFNKIKDNGYKLLYLSARAIGQARITRDYLRSIRQGDLTMPDGPILLNPTSLITAFHREVIEKKPEQFKISCLNDIRELFPSDSNPFYAGYGNRINDVWAYRAVGIPIMRIFTINPKGELTHELTRTFQSSYSNMSYIVDHLFSPLREAANDYSQFVYWREPMQNLEELPEQIL